MTRQPSPAGDKRALALAGDLRVVAGRLNRRMREQAQTTNELTGTQKSVLARLERDDAATVTSLARAEGMRPQSMGAIVAGLEAAGFVEGTPDPSDGRQTVLSLTAACRKWIRDGRAAREDWLFRAIRAEFTPAEQYVLAAGVELLERLIER